MNFEYEEITVDDLTGTVTMSLNDYEKLRGRDDKRTESIERSLENLNKQIKEFEKDSKNYEKGLFKKMSRATGDFVQQKGDEFYVAHDTKFETTWLGKEDVEKAIKEDYSKERENLYRDLRWMSIIEFINWRKLKRNKEI